MPLKPGETKKIDVEVKKLKGLEELENKIKDALASPDSQNQVLQD